MLTPKRYERLLLVALVAGCQGTLAEPEGSLAGPDKAADDKVADAVDDSAVDDSAVDDSAADDPARPSGEPTSVSCDTPAPGESPLRRLTNDEYRNTMVDLLAGEEELVATATQNFPREPTSLGFRTGAKALTITPLIADEYVTAAERFAPVVAAKWLPCELAEPDPGCVDDFVEAFGARVYRRPLTTAERDRYSALYAGAIEQDASAEDAAALVIAGLLSSPNFLFRVELSKGDTVERPSGFEMATRLSYLLWQTMPDDALFAAAARGELETAEGVESEVRRMMESPKALRVYEFFAQWLDVDEAESLSRSAQFYPDYDDSLRELLAAENRAFVYHLLTTGGTFADLLSADYTFANRALAEHYGLSEVPEGAAFEKVPAPERAGVLTQLPMLIHDRAARTSIVRRGLKLRTDFLCQIVPAPPADVDFTLPALDGELTQRDRLQAHRDNPSCAGCHELMDPLGEIFEGFDATGRVRQVDEGGAPVVLGGVVSLTSSLNGEYETPRQLAEAMSTDPQVRDCFALQAFRYFYGRDAAAGDECTEQQLASAFARNDYRLIDLLLGLTRSDQFLYQVRTVEVGQ